MIERLKRTVGLEQRPTVKSSDFILGEDPTDRLIDICHALNGDTYLSGRDGTQYMDLERFKQSGIKVIIQDFKHPVYPQVFQDFHSHMSAVDLFFNCGAKSLAKIEEINP